MMTAPTLAASRASRGSNSTPRAAYLDSRLWALRRSRRPPGWAGRRSIGSRIIRRALRLLWLLGACEGSSDAKWRHPMHSLGILVVAMAIVFTALESGGLAIPCGALAFLAFHRLA